MQKCISKKIRKRIKNLEEYGNADLKKVLKLDYETPSQKRCRSHDTEKETQDHHNLASLQLLDWKTELNYNVDCLLEGYLKTTSEPIGILSTEKIIRDKRDITTTW